MATKIQKAVSVLLFILLLLIFGLSLTLVWPAYNRYNKLRNDLAKLNHELQMKINESVVLNREVHDLEHKPAGRGDHPEIRGLRGPLSPAKRSCQ